MSMQLEIKLQIKSWDEKPYQELPDGRKFTQATVELAGAEERADIQATQQSLMYYAPDGTSSFVGIMLVTGRLGERSGTFVMRGTGTYDGTTASSEAHIVPGSGTEGLAGIGGTMLSSSTHADYPFMPLTLGYEIA